MKKAQPLPRSLDEIHKRSLDQRGRPAKSLRPPPTYGITEDDLPF